MYYFLSSLITIAARRTTISYIWTPFAYNLRVVLLAVDMKGSRMKYFPKFQPTINIYMQFFSSLSLKFLYCILPLNKYFLSSWRNCYFLKGKYFIHILYKYYLLLHIYYCTCFFLQWRRSRRGIDNPSLSKTPKSGGIMVQNTRGYVIDNLTEWGFHVWKNCFFCNLCYRKPKRNGSFLLTTTTTLYSLLYKLKYI